MNVVPAKKEESGVNYAVNQSSGAVEKETTSSPWINNILIIGTGVFNFHLEIASVQCCDTISVFICFSKPDVAWFMQN